MAAGSLQCRLLRMRVLLGGILISQKQKVMQGLCQGYQTQDLRKVSARGSAALGVTRSREDHKRNRPLLRGVHLPALHNKVDGRHSRTNRSVILPYICQSKGTLFAGNNWLQLHLHAFRKRLSDVLFCGYFIIHILHNNLTKTITLH